MSQLTIIGNSVKTRTTDSWCMLTTPPAMHNRHQLATHAPNFILHYPKQRSPDCWKNNDHKSNQLATHAPPIILHYSKQRLPDCWKNNGHNSNQLATDAQAVILYYSKKHLANRWKNNGHNSNQSPGGPGGSGRGRGSGSGSGSGGGNRNHDREDGEGGESPKRHHDYDFLEELERNTVGSVLSEWMKTRKSLPSYLHYPEFLGMMLSLIHARLDENIASIKGATFIWSLIRNLCQSFYPRIMRDEHFTKKLIFQFVTSVSFSLLWKLEGRPKKSEKFVSILASALTMAATESLVVWLLAPVSRHSSRNSGPSNFFEATEYKFEKFNVGQRMFCLVRSGINLFTLGTLVKAAEAVVKGDQAGFGRSSDIILGNGMFFGIDCNLRYQILCGLDRMMVDYFGDTKFTLALCAIFRATNAWIGAERSLKYALSSQPVAKRAAAYKVVV